MALTFGFRTPRDLFEKLKRDAGLLDDEVTSDRFFNFVVTGYSLIDWVRNNPAIPAAVKLAVVAMYADPWVKVCGDLATASKHFDLHRRSPVTSKAESRQGWGRGRYGKGGYGVGEEDIELTLGDGTSLSCLELAEKVVAAWERFFAANSM